MIKKKKIPKLLTELQNIILEKNNLLNVPEKHEQLDKKNISCSSDFNCVEYKFNNLIYDKNNLKFEKNEPTKDNMFKTFKYVLNPTSEQKKILIDYCDAHLEMYNLTIKKIKQERKIQRENTQKHNIKYCEMTYDPNITILKKYFEQDKEKLAIKYKVNKHILDYAINDCIAMFKSIVSNQNNKHINHSSMRYLKKSKNKKIFKVEKEICKNESFCTSKLGKILKIKPKLNYKNECQTVYTIQYNNKENKFYLLRKIKIEQKNIKTVNNSISIDPGMRTIMTGISENHILEIGTEVEKKIKRKVKKIKILKSVKNMNNNNRNKKIRKLENEIENYIKDFHWKTANHLVKNYDHIVIGNFSTSHMKRGTKGINLEVMKYLNMFNFRSRIKYKCLKHNKKYITIKEAYTTRLCVNCGEDNDIGSSKIYECKKCKKKYDRDIKSAGCIYLKALK